jgi:hypothetical protein
MFMLNQKNEKYMKNYVTIGGGLLIIVSMFLPYLGEENGMKSLENVAYFFIVCGALIMLCGFMGKKVLTIVGLILSLAVLGLAIKYKMDAGDLGKIGIWVMLGGGALAVIGSVMGLMKKAA